MRDKLIELIQNSVGGCARHWAEIIADSLIANGVTILPDGAIILTRKELDALNEYEKKIKADTIKKMQERLKKYYHHLSGKTLPASVEYHIDQIANEMLKEDE